MNFSQLRENVPKHFSEKVQAQMLHFHNPRYAIARALCKSVQETQLITKFHSEVDLNKSNLAIS